MNPAPSAPLLPSTTASVTCAASWIEHEQGALSKMSVPAGILATNPNPNSSIASPNVVDRVSSLVKRLVFLKDPSLYRLLALWIVHTYLVDEFEYTPYLFIHSPERCCGKTCLLSVLDFLVFKSSGITASPTEAVIFRSAHGHTQILDEADTYLPRLGEPGPESIEFSVLAGKRRAASVARGSGSWTRRLQRRRDTALSGTSVEPHTLGLETVLSKRAGNVESVARNALVTTNHCQLRRDVLDRARVEISTSAGGLSRENGQIRA